MDLENDFHRLLKAGYTVSEAFTGNDGKCRDAWSRGSCNVTSGYSVQMDYSKNRPAFNKGKT